jgi:hypothetical protein
MGTGVSKLTWKTAPISNKLCADTGGVGRFMIHPRDNGRFELRLNGFFVGVFDTVKLAKERAEQSFAALVTVNGEGDV